MKPLAVEFRGLNKSFHGLFANQDIDLKVVKGSIHAIIGENGAGKSTAMKILYGTYQPDAGEVWIHGRLWGNRGKPWGSSFDAIQSGIGMVHQHFMLGGPFTALDNLLLGVEPSLPQWRWLPSFLRPLDRRNARMRLEKLAEQYGLQVPLDRPVEELSVGVQQRVEILKLLYRDAEILILDEPTAVLTPQETQDLFTNLRRLAQQGKTVLIITHKLKEVMSLADRVTVFRAGKVVGEKEIQGTHVDDLATLMVGRQIQSGAFASSPFELKPPVLEISDLTVPLSPHRKLDHLNLSIQGGEIVGVCGVEGNGQADLLQLLLHPQDFSSVMEGEIRILGQDVRHYSANQVKALGVGVIPDDRLRDALLLDRPLHENFLLGLHRRSGFSRGGFISSKQLTHATQHALEEYDIRPRSMGAKSGSLSGGNQQKLVIAREFKTSPRFLIAAQPTRGVDIGAIEVIHKRIHRACVEGSGVLLISSELDEILKLSDRILVMYEGQFIAEFKRGEVDEKILGLRMGGIYASANPL